MENFDMRPRALIEELDLLQPIYRATSAYGHFGRSEFSWEKTDRAAALASDLLGVKLKGAKASDGAKANGAKANGASNGGAAAPKSRKAAKPKAASARN
jgi:S-adenosylmethionine synthetase